MNKTQPVEDLFQALTHYLSQITETSEPKRTNSSGTVGYYL